MGIVLIIASIAGGVAAGGLMPTPLWSIPSAVALTLCTIGMGVGVLWTLRSSWSEKWWARRDSDVPAGLRARRAFRNVGIVLLAPLPIAVALLAWLISEGDIEWSRVLYGGFLVSAYGASGVQLIRLSRGARRSLGARGSERPEEREDAGPGWHPLGGPLGSTLLGASLVPYGLLVLGGASQLYLAFDDGSNGAVLGIAFIAVAAVVAFLLFRRFNRQADVDVDSGLIRLGSTTIPWTEVVRAELMAQPWWTGSPRTLILVLGDDAKARGRVVLRRREALELSDEETDVLTRIIEASHIELPRDKDDPRGRFSRQLYPNALTKEQAAALVADPPTMDEDLPVGAPT
ncbi:hypothetical protein ACIGEP_13545 [Microbacterium sp. NPDC077663]|uniref:hypothetical protein n=1 Tax=Microbacterium sp. NPDC077663 TaxID=3364189 RepID=UPI0037C8F17D